MKLKENRILSFLIIGLIYVGATVVGVLVCHYLPFSFWLNLLLADLSATAFTFIFSLIFKNASVYDPYWSVQPIVISAFALIGKKLSVVRLLLFLVILIWGARLTLNWAYTFKNLNHQDWRYTMLKEKTGKLYPVINFIGIHLVPTLVVYACTLPAVFAYVFPAKWNVGFLVFICLSIFAFTLQGIADIEMHSFRKEKTLGLEKAPFINRGLWKYSRHPNYLGEILMWWGVGLSVVCVLPRFYYLLAGALLNTLLFVFVSLPMAEKRQSQKEGFDEYKKKTRLLLPIKK